LSLFDNTPPEVQVRNTVQNKLSDLESNFEFDGMDKMVLSMCLQDLSIYAHYIKDTHNKVFVRTSINNNIEITNPTDMFLNALIDTDLLIQDFEDDKKSIEAWTEWWFTVYKKRVKLTFRENDIKNSPISSFNKLTVNEIEEIKTMMKYSLIDKGEICGTTIIVDSLFNKVLSGYSDKIDWGVDKKLNLLNVMLRETRKLAQVTGVLIFIRPTKQSYNLKEYRDGDGVMPPTQ
jgi:hypothetical protein